MSDQPNVIDQVVEYWKDHGSLPSDLDPELYGELQDALRGDPNVPQSLLDYLSGERTVEAT